MNHIDITKRLLSREESLSKYATLSSSAIRIKEESNDIRPAFFRDIDRIIHSISYTRYIDKTQVFSFNGNDHVSKRIIHVQLVSKVARTIGRCLSLNEDLIEAIALGHDIGHTPIGHVGESILNEISMRELGQCFMHNVQSVRTYLTLDNNGKGKNLSIQVLDGILAHNGEMLSNIYEPNFNKTKEEFFMEYESCYKDKKNSLSIKPMTLEGCVVRISDVIAYIGRDIEDAIEIGLIKRRDIPSDIVSVLGNNNKDIVNNIILDIVENSYDKSYIKMSDEVFNALNSLLKFNYSDIYGKANNDDSISYYKKVFNALFSKFLNDLEYNKKDSAIYKVFINNMAKTYTDNTDNKRIVIDFIAGMTDDYLKEMYDNITVN